MSLADVGGLAEFKEWLLERVNPFDETAIKAGCSRNKGVICIGLPGSGKSLVSIVAGTVMELPIFELTMGQLMGGIVGQSEDNLKRVINIVEAAAPCILRIDEIDKGVGSSMSGPSTDSGTTERMVQMLLTWMNDKTSDVFIIATANDPKKLEASDGALIRSGRFDERFFFDLPTEEERIDILRIHLNKRSRKNPECPISPLECAESLDLEFLAQCTDGYTGAEIASGIDSAFRTAFSSKAESLSEVDLSIAFTKVLPLSQTMKENIDRTRKWATGRCRPASRSTAAAPKPQQHAASRKVAV